MLIDKPIIRTSLSFTPGTVVIGASGSFSGSFTGSFVGDGSQLTNLPITDISSLATTGSNTFIGNQIVSGSVDVQGNLLSSGVLLVAGTGTSTIAGNLTVGGTLTAQEFKAELISSSIIFESGSTKFGDSLDDTHERTGSFFISGSSFNLTSSNFNFFGTYNQSGTANITNGQLNVDNLRLDGNTISSTNSNGNINLDPDGTGVIDLLANTNVTGTLNASVALTSSLLTVDNISIDANTISSLAGDVVLNSAGKVQILDNVEIGSSNLSLGTTSTANRFTFDGGNFGSPIYQSGFAGSGFILQSGSSLPVGGSASGSGWRLELDHLSVRGSMQIYELLVNQIRATNGALWVSSVGKVEAVTGGPTTFFLSFVTGSASGSIADFGHGFFPDDLIRAQRSRAGGPINASTGSRFEVYTSDLRVISASGAVITASLRPGSIAPSASFEYVRIGNTGSLYTNRRGAIYLTSDDVAAPFIDVIDNVTSFESFEGADKSKVRMGKLNGITSAVFGPLTGSGGSDLYGFWASGSAYLEGSINATAGRIANWEIIENSITSSNIHLSSSNGGVIRMGSTLPASHTSGNGIFLSGSGQALIGSASGHRIQFDGSNLILSSSTFLLGNASNLISGSGGNIRISGSSVSVETPTFLLGNANNFVSGSGGNVTISGSNVSVLTPTFFLGNSTNFVSGSGGNIRISGSNVTVQTPSFFLGGATQFISGSGGNVQISSSNFHLLNGNITASNATLSGTITANAGQIGGWIVEPDRLYASSSLGGLFLSASERSIVMRSGSKESLLIGESVNFTGTLDEIALTAVVSASISASATPRSYLYLTDPGDRNSEATASYTEVFRNQTLLGTIEPLRANIPVNFSGSFSLTNNSNVVQSSITLEENIVSVAPVTTYSLVLKQGSTTIGSNLVTIDEGALISSSIQVSAVPTSTATIQVYATIDAAINGPANVNYLLKFESAIAKQYRPVTFINSDGVFSKISPITTISLLNVGSGTVISTGGAGGGGVSSITAADGLTGGTITSAGTITIDTGSNHFISGARKTISVSDTTGASGIDLTYNNGTGVLSGTLATSSLIVNAGSGLAGGGAVSLGGTTTLTVNSGSMLPFYSSSIFTRVSGDVLIDSSTGVATIQANSVALGTDTTGNYVGTITAGTGIDTTGATTGEGVAHSISVDVSDFMSNGADNRVVTATGTDAMNAEANVTFDGTTLTVNGNLTTTGNTTLGNATSDLINITGSIGVSGSFNILQSSYGAQVSSSIANGASDVVVASLATGSFHGVFFDYTIGSTSARRIGTVMTAWQGANIEFTDFSTLDIGTTINVSLATSLSGPNVRLLATNNSGVSIEIRTITRAI